MASGDFQILSGGTIEVKRHIAFSIACPNCQKDLDVTHVAVGAIIKCPKCKNATWRPDFTPKWYFRLRNVLLANLLSFTLGVLSSMVATYLTQSNSKTSNVHQTTVSPAESKSAPSPLTVPADEWPALSDEQVASWASTLSPLKISVITVFWGPEVEARRFFQSLQKVGKRINVPVRAGLGQADANTREIEFSATKESGIGTALLQLLQSSGYPAKFTERAIDKEPHDVSLDRAVDIFLPDRS